MGRWDIEFMKRRQAAYEAAKAQQRERVEQLELRARAAEAAAKLRAAAEVKDKPKATARHKKIAEAVERTKRAINAKYSNGSLALNKDARNKLRNEEKVSDRTISRALRELRNAQPNRAK